ncbi:hypothetical protein HDU93_007883, partial [Gonapodya sp. JEL0774]
MPPKSKSRQATNQASATASAAPAGPTPEQIVEQCFTELHKLLAAEDDDDEPNHSAVVKQCDKILRLVPTDTAALHFKATALAKLEQFSESLTTYESLRSAENRSSEPQAYAFERGYCLYRLNKLQEAKDVAVAGLEAMTKDETGYQELLQLNGQIHYRMESFALALSLYAEFIRTVSEDTPLYEYILANFEAIKASALVAGLNVEGEFLPSSPLGAPPVPDSHELAQNRATQLLALGREAEAVGELERALDLAQSTLEADSADRAEMDRELGPLRLLIGCARHATGDTEAAKEMYSTVAKLKSPTDLPLLATHNLGLVLLPTSPLDAQKRLKHSERALTTSSDQIKLTAWQRKALDVNAAIGAAWLGKDGRKKCADVAAKWPDVIDVKLAGIASYVKEGKVAIAQEEIEALCAANPSSLPAHLSLAHVYILNSNLSAALSTLDALCSADPTFAKLPALVGLRSWLLKETGDVAGAKTLLESAVEGWRKSGTLSNPTPALTALANLHLLLKSPSAAASLLETALRQTPGDPALLLQLVQTYLLFDPVKAQRAEAGIDVKGLEAAAAKVDAEAVEGSVGTAKGRRKGDGEQTKPKKKRKRVKRWPKGFSAENPPTSPPDPERWLPKSQRSSFKVKGRKAKNLFRGPQGAAVAGGGLGGTRSANIAGAAVQAKGDSRPQSALPEAAPSPASAPAPAKSQQQSKKKKG